MEVTTLPYIKPVKPPHKPMQAKKAKQTKPLTQKARDRKKERKLRRKQRGKSNIKTQRNSARDFALSFFRRGSEYTDNILLARLICKEMDWHECEDMLDIKHVIRKFQIQQTGKRKHQWTKRSGAEFYSSKAWKTLRYHALTNTDGCCQCCGARASDGVSIHVDHIKPRSKHPELELDLSNLQVLCNCCNTGKDNIDETNWRQHWESI